MLQPDPVEKTAPGERSAMVAQGHGMARFSGSYPNQQNCRDSGRAEACA